MGVARFRGTRWRVQVYDRRTRKRKHLGVFATRREAEAVDAAFWREAEHAPRRTPTRPVERALHSLYFCYDDAGRLLYVGIARRPLQRFTAHERDKDWWARVATIAVTHYPSRSEALIAEAWAIAQQHPERNYQGRVGYEAREAA